MRFVALNDVLERQNGSLSLFRTGLFLCSVSRLFVCLFFLLSFFFFFKAFAFSSFWGLFAYYPSFAIFFSQLPDLTERDCRLKGDKCPNVPGRRGKRGKAGKEGGYAGYSGKCDLVTSVGHKRGHLLATFLSK